MSLMWGICVGVGLCIIPFIIGIWLNERARVVAKRERAAQEAAKSESRPPTRAEEARQTARAAKEALLAAEKEFIAAEAESLLPLYLLKVKEEAQHGRFEMYFYGPFKIGHKEAIVRLAEYGFRVNHPSGCSFFEVSWGQP